VPGRLRPARQRRRASCPTGPGSVAAGAATLQAAIAETYTVSVATPAGHAAGISTPDLVAFDDERDIAPVPLSVFERAPGEPLLRVGAHPHDLRALWHDVGRELALLHANVRGCDDPNGYLDDHSLVADHEELVTALREDGILGEDATVWLDEVLERLRPFRDLSDTYRRFIHGDVTPSNVLVKGGALQRADRLGRCRMERSGHRAAQRAAARRGRGPLGLPIRHANRRRRIRRAAHLVGQDHRRTPNLFRLPRANGAAGSGTPAGPLVELQYSRQRPMRTTPSCGCSAASATICRHPLVPEPSVAATSKTAGLRSYSTRIRYPERATVGTPR
jgi:hypothetical protein